MQPAVKSRSRVRNRLAAFALVGATAAVLALPAGASASNISCFGVTALGTPDQDTPNPVSYTLTCSDPITAFTLISDRTIAGFTTEIGVVDYGNQVVGTDSFNCEGDIPGHGVNCKGVYGAQQRKIQGAIDLDAPLCSPTATRLSLVVVDAKGAMAGPFRLATPKCAKPKPQPAKRKTRKKKSRA